jgi:hypothetical protein
VVLLYLPGKLKHMHGKLDGKRRKLLGAAAIKIITACIESAGTAG